jgi:hypothetical protein
MRIMKVFKFVSADFQVLLNLSTAWSHFSSHPPLLPYPFSTLIYRVRQADINASSVILILCNSACTNNMSNV